MPRDARLETAREVARRALEGGLEFADTTQVDKLEPYVKLVICALGCRGEVFVSDESSASDFVDRPADIQRAGKLDFVSVR